VLVPAGEFWMGNTAAEVERLKKEDCKVPGPSVEQCEREAPRHRVHLDAYYIDRYEITNALFERFVRATNHRTSAEQEGDAGVSLQKDGQWEWAKVPGATWRTPSGPGTKAPPDHPVVNVSWEDAQAYCRWAGKRLPTEAEWEKAARGTDGRRYPWGEIWESSRANGAITVKTTSPVGSYPTGVSPFGAHDMSGNVWEWVSDWFAKEYYASSPERNPTGPPSGSLHPVRGGSWVPNPTFLRSTSRLVYSPTNRYSDLGFRCAKGSGP